MPRRGMPPSAAKLALLALPFYLQHSLGQDTLMTGLYMTPGRRRRTMLSDSGRSRGHAAGWNEFRVERQLARCATWHSR